MGQPISRLNDQPETPDPDRFTLGTYAPIEHPSAAIMDTHTGEIYPFGRWENAQRAIGEMRRADSPLFYAAVLSPRERFFTEAAPNVEGARP